MKLMYETANDVSFEQELNEASGEKKYKIKGIFSSPGQKNKNGRIYPMPLWEKEVNEYQNILKSGHVNALMELEHPPRSNVDMMEAVAKIEKLYIKDGYVMGEAVLLNNPKANQLKTLIDNGIKMSVSTRGLGKVNNGIVEEFKLITVDIIPNLAQSDYQAEMMGIVEGVLTEKEFLITESGRIEEVQICTDSACHMFEKTDVEKAVREKFKKAIEELSDGCKDKKDELQESMDNKSFLKDLNIRVSLLKEAVRKESNDIYGSIESLISLLKKYKGK